MICAFAHFVPVFGMLFGYFDTDDSTVDAIERFKYATNSRAA